MGAQRLSGPADPGLPGLVGRWLTKQLCLENRYCFRRCALRIASYAPWDSPVSEKFQGQNIKSASRCWLAFAAALELSTIQMLSQGRIHI